ncbi:MAG: hypothetical protein NPIRA05_05800 [Nitrospirales bacterium]|nr:MAG: hypothetical protein NPIRA05_05800 [Nitrospirales bacterium]
MSGAIEPSLRLLASFLAFIFSAGCAMNSFQATVQVSEWRLRAGQSGEFKEMNDECTSESTEQNAFVLIHGIYGDEDTFGQLQDTLRKDEELGQSDVYLMEYWSSRFFPNFQSLSELGQAFKIRIEQLVDCKKPETIIIIAHSQGGLIAKEAVLAWKEKGDPKGILGKTKLVLIGTPNSFSTYAGYNNLFVNSLFAPITYVTGIFSAPFGKAFVYNRQAFDMADSIRPFHSIDSVDLFRSKFMLNHIAKWGEYFPTGVFNNPKTYAIVGIKNLFDNYGLSDGIVHADTLLFAGIPDQRVRYVPYRHFDDLVSIEEKHHRTFTIIKNIASGKLDKTEVTPNADKSAQKLSPFKNLPYSLVTFVMEQSLTTNHDENDKDQTKVELQGIDLDGKRPFLETIESRAKSDISTTILGSIGRLVLLPFQSLLNLAYPATHIENYVQRVKSGRAEPKWRIRRLPDIVLDGDHEGIIEVSRRREGTSWYSKFFGTDDEGYVHYRITDDPDYQKSTCRASYPIIWAPSKNSSLTTTDNTTPKIRLQRNAVNYIKVELTENEISLTRVGCT